MHFTAPKMHSYLSFLREFIPAKTRFTQAGFSNFKVKTDAPETLGNSDKGAIIDSPPTKGLKLNEYVNYYLTT